MQKNCYSIIFFLFFLACQQEQKVALMEADELQENLIINNEFLAREEKFRIERFVQRSILSFQKTGTGLFFYITKEGKGNFIQENEIVFLNYKVHGIDGTFYYENLFDQPLEFMVGKYDIASGIHQGILNLKLGEKAIFILPSHLAHGLLGDREKIPPRMPIIWEVEILKVLTRQENINKL